MNKITLNCNAKINLSLDVVDKRADGYHNIELIFLEIPLADTLTISLRTDGLIILSCDDKTLPTDEKNIAYRAAQMFFDVLGTCCGADIILNKKIPHGAGLAGGSADAAGVLKGLNELHSYPFSTEQLMEMGAKLGADVPFCVIGGCAFAEGIGEILTPLPRPKGLHYLLVKPNESISTAYVYQNLKLVNRPDGISVRKIAEYLKSGDYEAFYDSAKNIMEAVTAEKVPAINILKQFLIENGAKIALMSGSGTTVFGVFNDLSLAENAYGIIKTEYPYTYLV